jgi:hypothetical protein
MADIYFDGPEPPPGREWCAVCVMLVKQHVVAEKQELVRQASVSDADAPAVRVTMAPSMKGQELNIAVTHAISTVVPQFGALPVCWSHALGLELRGGLMPANPAEAAMFSQAAQLGNSKQQRPR